MTSPGGALSGVLVVDFSRVLAGPYATMLLADLGATVVKIERPDGGDETRAWGPPWSGGVSTYFQAVNRNKRSVSCDLSEPGDLRVVTELCRISRPTRDSARTRAASRTGIRSRRDEGLRAAERVRTRHPTVGVLVLSHYAETAYAVRLLECSSRAVGYLVKDRVQDPDRLVDALRRVVAGEVVIDPDVIQRVMLRQRVVDPLHRLTPGERQVLALMAEGRSNAAIAATLNYSVKTVEKRVTAISEKLGPRDVGGCEPNEVNVRVLAVITYPRSAAGRTMGQ